MPRKKTTGSTALPSRANAANSLPLPRSFPLAGTAIQPTQIFAIPNRHPRGQGPWTDEPDRVAWQDARTGLDCLILRQDDGTLSGYAAVPPSHPLAGYRYDAVPSGIRAVPHRGMHYSAACDRRGPEGISICHIEVVAQRRAAPSLDHAPHGADAWWFGFDTDHPGDFVPKGAAPNLHREEGEIYRDLDYVAAETMKLASALKALDTAGAPIEPSTPLPLGAPVARLGKA
jgi:hypothetical protein